MLEEKRELFDTIFAGAERNRSLRPLAARNLRPLQAPLPARADSGLRVQSDFEPLIRGHSWTRGSTFRTLTAPKHAPNNPPLPLISVEGRLL